MTDSTYSDGLSPAEERSLVDRSRRGDQEAQGLLYDAYIPRLYRYCLSRVGNETDAEDLAEEIFLKVLSAIDGFQWQPARAPGDDSDRSSGALGASVSEPREHSTERIPFGAWLFRIAHNHVVSFHRRVATRGPVSELSEFIQDHQRGPEELTEQKITIEEVFALVRELPEAQREVILLRFASGLTVAETAEALGKHETNVKVLQHKGVQKLKRLLADADNGISSKSRISKLGRE